MSKRSTGRTTPPKLPAATRPLPKRQLKAFSKLSYEYKFVGSISDIIWDDEDLLVLIQAIVVERTDYEAVYAKGGRGLFVSLLRIDVIVRNMNMMLVMMHLGRKPNCI